jgi:decaprenylphospho-beta-D-ribofuranose 2-oxidase
VRRAEATASAPPLVSGCDGADTERLLTGWGRTAPSRARVTAVRDEGPVIATVMRPPARGVIGRGLGRSYGDAAQNAGGAVLDMTGLAGIRSLDAERGVVTVGAGTSLDELMRRLLPIGWFVPVTPGTRFVTVGGAIASDVHGKNHHRDGGFCAHVEAFELVTPAAGRITVTPGGMGLTGLVLEATLRLIRVQTSWMRVDVDRTTDLDATMSALEVADAANRYSVACLDGLAGGGRLGRGIVTSGDHATLDDLPPGRRGGALAFAPKSLAAVPFGAPPGTLGPMVARAFNEGWYRRSPARARGRLQRLSSFFHPLDGIANWNRLFGPRGFLQYQFVVPFGRDEVVRMALERLSSARCPSFLAVLKRFGEQEGLLSFPRAGWTLALDIPAGAPGLGRGLDGLDELVATAGGRVYLAKDSRLRADQLEAMYPELRRWREIRECLDPDHAMRSDLDRRLGLTHSGRA